MTIKRGNSQKFQSYGKISACSFCCPKSSKTHSAQACDDLLTGLLSFSLKNLSRTVKRTWVMCQILFILIISKKVNIWWKFSNLQAKVCKLRKNQYRQRAKIVSKKDKKIYPILLETGGLQTTWGRHKI